MKLNVKNAVFVSMAMIIWGIYLQLIDTTIQIVIVNNLGQTEEVKGIIIGIVNFMPLLLFPLFAKLSDNTTTKIGRRAPFIIIGTLMTIVLIISAALFAEQGSVLGYAIFFTLSYIGISIYRPAATAILPDIIPKPLRSKANAIKGIINAFGGLIVLALVAIFGDANMLATYIISAVFMAIILILYMLNINEPKLVKEAEIAMAEYLASCDDETKKKGESESFNDKGPRGYKYVLAMPKQERKSLIFILLSVFMVTYGYGAMIATYQNYAFEVWDMTHSAATIFIVLIGVGGLASTPIISMLSDKKGRKNTMLIGYAVFIVGVSSIILFESVVAMRFIGFVLLGSGWAFVTIISYPMVLELSDTYNNGAFTSYFTLACTIPKAMTAYTSGVMLTRIGYQILYPYTLFFIVLGMIAMFFVKHGDVIGSNKKMEEIKWRFFT